MTDDGHILPDVRTVTTTGKKKPAQKKKKKYLFHKIN